MGEPAKAYRAYEETGSRWDPIWRVAFVLLLFAFPVVFGPWGLVGAVGVVGVVIARMLWKLGRSAVVGADGVLVGTRFIAFPEIERIERIESKDASAEIVLYLRSKERLRLVTRRPRRKSIRAYEPDVLAAELERALLDRKAALQADAGGDEHPALERGRRSLPEWLATVKTVASGEMVEYRSAEISLEELWHTVERPGASDDARVAAAIALKETFDQAARARMHQAASSLVSPKVRIVLDAVADEMDDDQLIGTLKRAGFDS